MGWSPSCDRFLGSGDFPSGEEPIYIGFGSTVGGDFDKILDVVLESVERTGQRVLLSAGWRSIGNRKLPDNFALVGNVLHEWPFHQVKAVSHHGGGRYNGSKNTRWRAECNHTVRRRPTVLGQACL